jgi:hypothetical protein
MNEGPRHSGEEAMMHASKQPPSASKSLAKAKFIWIRQVCSDQTLGHLSCRVAALLLDHINLTSEEAWPSQARLAEAAGVTTRSIQSALHSLRLSGHLAVRRSKGRNNRYRPNFAPANQPSGDGARQPQTGSKTHEQTFSRFQKTPLEGRFNALKGEERRRVGHEMLALARHLGSSRPVQGGKDA